MRKLTEKLGQSASDITRKTYFDDSEQKFHISYTQDVEPILERNARMRNESSKKFGDGRVVASIPITLVKQWEKSGIKLDELTQRELFVLIEEYNLVKTIDARLA
jgi:hypothetical protein